MLKVGWFSTGNGKGSYKLLEYVKSAMGNDIDIVFCATDSVKGTEGVDNFFGLLHTLKIQRCYIDPKGKHVVGMYHDVIDLYRPDVLVLAGYMQIIPADVLKAYKRLPILNIHPALPHGPIGTYKQVEAQIKKSKATETGVMIHLVTEEIDRGPVVSWCQFNINEDTDLRAESILREGYLMVATLCGGFGDLTILVDGCIIKL